MAKDPICFSMYVPDKDIEAYSRKYAYAFGFYLAVWLFQLWFFDMDTINALLYTLFYWWITVKMKPIQFTPYWEKPEWQKEFLAKGLPW